MMIHMDPTNDSSPVIKRQFKLMDNPSQVLEVLQGILIIKEGVVSNNIMPGREGTDCGSSMSLQQQKKHILTLI
jgi:hypothetical protein